jgi:anaphase-promoting complex subunit 10
VRVLDLADPAGWIYVRIKRPGEPGDGAGLRAYLVQLVVLTNHQNGRDTHVRQVKVFGPRKCARPAPAGPARRRLTTRRAAQGHGAGCGARGDHHGGLFAVRGGAMNSVRRATTLALRGAARGTGVACLCV